MMLALKFRCKTCRAEPGQWCVKGWGKKQTTAKNLCQKRLKRAKRIHEATNAHAD